MGKDCNHSDILLQRNGTDQNQRFIDALSPDSVKLHDLSMEDWMAFAHDFAVNVNYFKTETNKTDGQNWQQFFLGRDELKKRLEEAKSNNDFDPHLVLFACFLNLIDFSQKRLNGLTKRHLDFYYKKVLNLDRKAAVSDKVHVLFELAKNASEVRVTDQTALDGGKDGIGVKRVYKTTEELIVNKAKVGALKNVFHEAGKGVRYSEVANSYDGFGETFPNDEIKWWPFGHPDLGSDDPMPNLPLAKLGFAVASPILLLKEGLRTVTFTFDFETNIKASLSGDALAEALGVLFSGEKEWISGSVEAKGSSLSGKTMTLVVALSEGLDAVLPYNQEVLLENFNSTNPIARFLFKSEGDNPGYRLYNILRTHPLIKIGITIQVQEMQELVLENDLGRLDPSKPFLPFGPQPVKGSKLYIGCQEALNKPWTKIQIDLRWKDTPRYEENDMHFVKHYHAYRKGHLTNLGKDTYTLSTSSNATGTDGGLIVEYDSDFKVDVETLSDRNWQPRTVANDGVLFEEDVDESYKSTLIIEQANTETKGTSLRNMWTKRSLSGPQKSGIGFSKKISERARNDIKTLFDKTLVDFSQDIVGGTHLLFDNPVQQDNFSSTAKKGFVRLSLQRSFLHALYPKIYAVALSKFEDSSGSPFSALIPNEPYTPLADTLRMGYNASISKNFNLKTDSGSTKTNLADYLDESLELFHEHPFGQSEQHTYLKSNHNFLSEENKICTLVPNHDKGELFIGLENTEQLQTISLLVQVLEGSENPEYEGIQTFEGNEKLEWFILSHEEWKPLNQDHILFNGTDNFLKSGIVRMSIPKEATKNNTRLPGDFLWLKIKNVKEFDTSCQAVSINAQAVLAEFENNANELSHLETGLPAGTISKLVERIATLKGVSQPHSSFDGVSKESDAQFYRRVSERLRHKQRALTVSDYEQLVLQRFPDIYKTNCLKHTSTSSELAPGSVSVMVIPNIVNRNVFDPYKPRISKAKRNEIQHFINSLNTLHVNALVENPQYQEVRISLKVKFHAGKDANFYSKELQGDITKFLAPWAYEETAEINFGITLHKSIILFYIEKLGYVDYVKDFELQLATDRFDVNGNTVYESVDKVVPKNSKTILTSVKLERHIVGVIDVDECVTT